MKSTHNTTLAWSKSALCTLALVLGTAALIGACSSVAPSTHAFSQDSLPSQIKVPVGHKPVLETTAVGTVTYECRANSKSAGTYEWELLAPNANLMDRSGKEVAHYQGPPATWTHVDGSSITAAPISAAANGTSNLPLQLSKAEVVKGKGSLQNITYIQRIKTMGGLDFNKNCGPTDIGVKLDLPYRADYIFWRAA